jgi:hypothetical protein
MGCPVQARAAALIEHATTLHADLTEVFAESRALIALGRERRLTSTYPRLRVIRGGSDVALVTETIAEARLCLHCIATMAGVSINQVDDALKTIAGTLRLRIGPHRCDSCRQYKTTFSLTKDGHP